MVHAATFFTIDGESTKDIDDAIAIEQTPEGLRVLVAIADPTTHVAVGSDLDARARARAATVYVRDRASQKMLPTHVSEHACSLMAGEQRSAFVFEMHLDSELQVSRFQPHHTTISVAARLSYRDVPAIIAAPEHQLHAPVKAASVLAQGLLAGRRKKGALALYDLEQMLLTDEEGNPLQLKSREDTVGHVVVQELMIAANSQLAQYMVASNIPAIYRNHTARLAAPSQEDLLASIRQLMAEGALESVRSRLGAVLDRARYQGVVLGHYGLNLPAYLHGTSPLRRYVDLVNLRQLKAHLIGTELPYTTAEVARIACATNETLEARKDEVSSQYKGAVERRAKARMEAGRLRQLDEPHLCMAVKTAREDGVLPEPLCAELIRRMQQDQLTDKVADRLLFNIEREAITDHLAAALGQWLRNNITKGPRFIAYALQTGRLQDFEVPCEQVGGRFAAHARARVAATGQIISGTGHADRKKLAEQLAICDLVARVAGLPVSVAAEMREVCARLAAAGFTPPRNAKQDLFEVCAKRRLNPPSFAVTSSGPAHCPQFTCTATLKPNGQVVSVTSSVRASKRDAEVEASSLLLQALGWGGPDEVGAPNSSVITPAPVSDTGNAIGDVQEYMQRAKLPLPDYEIATVSNQPPLFVCRVTVTLGGAQQTFAANGSSKAEAKKGAARLVLNALQAEAAC